MTALEAFICIAIVYYLGEFISTKTKSWVPSVFVTACLFLAGYWTVFPKNIVEIAGLGAPLGGTIVIMICITHMGTLINIKQFKEQWKIICITMAGLLGMIVFCWIICIPLVGKAFVVAGLPPLSGGIIAATLMSEEASKRGLELASVLAIAMYSAQGFVGYPLTAILLKQEGKILLTKYRNGELKDIENNEVDITTGAFKPVEEKKKLIPSLPQSYITPAFILLKLAIVAYLATKFSELLGGRINAAVVALIFGIIATELGFLEKNALQKASAQGFLLYILMVFVYSGLRNTTPEMLFKCLGPMVIIIIVGVVGLMIFSAIVGRKLKVSWRMAAATSLTALYGFPSDYILTTEAAKSLTEDENERKFLIDSMLPQMIVAGFITVTITSVIIASVFVRLF